MVEFHWFLILILNVPPEAEELIGNEICVVVINSCVEWPK